ncbi:E3 ubiquitin-protein ligase TRIM33-like [Patiria miniata]|uniref:Uncharacterized protein n=1 Tax=Patiria miniata TaxID=46514 RepID=A0A914A853_PATMI|nr:E3 ubiquitin-protein ligase TRIM33-like [Patiria miniata]
MATGGTAEVLEKISERHLQCSICYNRFTEPKLLDCIHTFCLNCLQHLRRNQDPNVMKIKCPLCRRETILGRKRVEDLPANLTLSALVEEFTIQEQLLKGQGSEIRCQSCDAEYAAISFCMECPHFLCQNCKRTHERLPATKFHKTVTMDQLRSGEVAYKSKLREEPKCDKHADQNINVYCNTCEQLVCTTCSVLKHEKHSRSDISEAFEECKQEISDRITVAEQKKTALRDEKECMVKSHKKLDSMFESTNKKISQKADKEVARIREMEKKLKKEAKEIYKDRVKTFETAENNNNKKLKEVEQILDEVNQLMAQEIQNEILGLKPKLLQNLKKLKKKQPENVPDELHCIDFHEGDEKTLGRLILKDEWRLKKHIAYRTDSVAIFSDEIVTVNKSSNELMSHISSSSRQSPVTSQTLNMPELRDPDQVAVNRLDQLIVLDGPVIKTFSRKYKLLHQFQPGRGSNSKPTCLAVDDNNQIAVGYQAKQEISLHKPDGTLLKKLPAPGISDQLAISNQHLVYIKPTEDKLAALDYNGNIAFEVDVKSPKSVCCDSQGNIYIIVSTHPRRSILPAFGLYQQHIEIFSPDGQNMGYLPVSNTDDLPRYPGSMAFTPSGDLVIGTCDTLQIFQQV